MKKGMMNNLKYLKFGVLFTNREVYSGASVGHLIIFNTLKNPITALSNQYNIKIIKILHWKNKTPIKGMELDMIKATIEMFNDVVLGLGFLGMTYLRKIGF